MSFILKADVEGSRPRVQIIDLASRRVVLDWKESLLWHLLNSAQLGVEELRAAQDRETTGGLIDKLLRIDCQLELAPLAVCSPACAGVVAWRQTAPGTVRLFMAGWPVAKTLLLETSARATDPDAVRAVPAAERETQG